jgi:peptidoglycan hydrolase-like protein with peptidoglycan-binding domain
MMIVPLFRELLGRDPTIEEMRATSDSIEALLALVRHELAELEGESYPGAPLRRGDRSERVREWQRRIGVLPDGIFGPVTEATTKRKQADHGLDPTGVVDETTWRKVAK